MTDIELADAEALCTSATPGPWQWFGNTKTNEVYLSTINRGRVFVMDFERWGMNAAQPRFQIDHIMRRLGDLGKDEHPMGPCFEASHRRQFVGIGHPDAAFIAAARKLLPAALTEIKRLRAQATDDAAKMELAAVLLNDSTARSERIGVQVDPLLDRNDALVAQVARLKAALGEACSWIENRSSNESMFLTRLRAAGMSQ